MTTRQLARLTVPALPGDLLIGDYVFATRWGDADWNDPWAVGFVVAIGKNFVRLGNMDGTPIDEVGNRAFLHAVEITGEQGARILREYRPREGEPFDPAIASQIVTGENR